MAQMIPVPAEERPLGRKSDLKQVRREGKVPAVLYGKGLEPRTLQLPAREIEAALHHHGHGAILELNMAGGERLTAIIKELELHRLNGRIHHLGLQSIRMSDVIQTSIPLVLAGRADAVENSGGMVEQQLTDLPVTGRADQLPEAITVDISSLEMGQTLRVGDIPLPEGVTTSADPDGVVANTSVSAAARQEAAEAAEAAEVAPAAATAAAGDAGT